MVRSGADLSAGLLTYKRSRTRAVAQLAANAALARNWRRDGAAQAQGVGAALGAQRCAARAPERRPGGATVGACRELAAAACAAPPARLLRGDSMRGGRAPSAAQRRPRLASPAPPGGRKACPPRGRPQVALFSPSKRAGRCWGGLPRHGALCMMGRGGVAGAGGTAGRARPPAAPAGGRHCGRCALARGCRSVGPGAARDTATHGVRLLRAPGL